MITFHRYLPSTHDEFLKQIRASDAKDFIVFPLYPQFSYATTGSIARFFEENLEAEIVQKMKWIRSYPTHKGYVAAMQRCIADYLKSEKLEEKDVVLFFSAHGLPQEFIDQGDPYEFECHLSFDAIRRAFPNAYSLLAFQSKFGPGEWLRPYTNELCETPRAWNHGKPNVVFIPLSFTSDHIETLFEIEHLYLPSIRAGGLEAFRCPALNRRQDWMASLVEIIQEQNHALNEELVRA